MASTISWLAANWMQVVVALLAIDAAIIPIFPNATILEKIQTYLNDAKNV